jgi:hypothetical protein
MSIALHVNLVYKNKMEANLNLFFEIWAALTLSVPIFLLQSQQKGFPLQSLPQYIHSKRPSFLLPVYLIHFGIDLEK